MRSWGLDWAVFLCGWSVALLLGIAAGWRGGRRRGTADAYTIGLGDGRDLERLRYHNTIVAMRRARP